MTLLMGDQVYLDLPTLQDFKNEVPWLAKKFEDDYTINWQVSPGYSQVLAAAPSISMPDDHEFWNNYPHPSPIVGNTLHHKGRDNWRKAALALYEVFQLPYPSSVGEPTIIEVAPLSFFLPDMRSLRDEDRRFTMNDRAHRKMKDWVTDLIARKDTIDRKLFGVVITGQSLFSEPTQ
jgi:phosphodiesterase/alkaline phosphatase D-like protein